MTEKDMTYTDIRNASIAYSKVKKIVDKWYDERYDTDWDFLQGSLMKIYKAIHGKNI